MRILRPLLVLATAADGHRRLRRRRGVIRPDHRTACHAKPRPPPRRSRPNRRQPACSPSTASSPRAKGELAVYASTAATTPASTLPAQTEFGSPMTVRVVGWEGSEGEWLEVLLPVRPNGSRGFVRQADVELAHVEYAVDVDLATRTLRVFEGDALGARDRRRDRRRGEPDADR